MRNALRIAVIAAALIAAAAQAGDVYINIGAPPAFSLPGPPDMVPVPRSLVYFAPGVDRDLVFYRGYWWTKHKEKWFRSREYKGPWLIVDRTPLALVRLPRDYRRIPPGHSKVPYGQLKKHYALRLAERRERKGEWKDWKPHGKGHGHKK